MIKLFYVTDIHGSNVCYRKFLNALPIYGVDVAVLNGDLLGKVLIPKRALHRLIEGSEPAHTAPVAEDAKGAEDGDPRSSRSIRSAAS